MSNVRNYLAFGIVNDRKKERLISVLAQMAFNKQMPQEPFEKLKLAVDYAGGTQIDNLSDHKIIALIDWVKRGACRANDEVYLVLPHLVTADATINCGF